jgi:hypothetical protein
MKWERRERRERGGVKKKDNRRKESIRKEVRAARV